MARILHLETSALNCSVSLSDERKLIASHSESSTKYIHAERLHVLIDKCIREAQMEPADLDAVSIGRGPGSYTGLRIGTSAAKGLCYALNIPLISIDTWAIIFAQMKEIHGTGFDCYVPLIDARRMEAYAIEINAAGHAISEIRSVIWDDEPWKSLESTSTLFAGDAAEKFALVAKNPKWSFDSEIFPDSKYMVDLAVDLFEKGEFQDVAYFEPFYLKNFVAGKPKDLLKRK